ncbi:N-6 DNA methylase [Microcoleus sp. N9_A1]|uniref:N-6 DNA methylase n=1 Tax=Microcoleus sp. N9_A1 TaxID=3055380 RepID=UPI002FD3F11C
MPKNKTTNVQNKESLEQKLWKAADKLRKNIDAAEYKHIVLGLVFLKYISDSFEQLHEKLIAGEGDYAGADPEDSDEYKAENVFFVPAEARWSALQAQAKQPTIGQIVDEAMEAIERENPKLLKGILPKVYGQQKLDPIALGGLIDNIGSVNLAKVKAESDGQLILDLEPRVAPTRQADLLGQVYEYFLGEFALAEGKKGGQFYTPESVVRVLVEMLEPYKGRVFDPCCGSGGMFVQSEKFVKAHQGRLDDISIYGQESNETTYKLCRMNLAIRGIDGSNIRWNTEGSFLKDAHPDLKADFVIANPPFNDSDWVGRIDEKNDGGHPLRNDGRWQYGTPPVGSANFAWVQHFLYHLAPTGAAGFVLSNGSLSSNTSGEGEIRQQLVRSDLVDCIVMMPTQLFYNTGIPACLWFLSRSKNGNKNRDRKEEVLFIDASELGAMVNRRNRAFDDDDIQKIAGTYHEWKRDGGNYVDIKGFCKSATLAEIEKHNFVLTPGRYVGIPDEVESEISFEETMIHLNQSLQKQTQQARKLDREIREQLHLVYPSLDWSEVDFSSSEVLEYIAQTLFKHWFVDFEFPNEDGKPYKSSGGEMVRSELGEIPAGWKARKLDDVLSLIIDYRGKTPKKLGSDWSLTGIPALSAKNIKNGRIVREDAINFVDEDLYQKWMKDELQKGDVLLTSEAPLGEVYYLANNRKYVLSQRLFCLRTKLGFDSTYLYFWLKSIQGQFLLERRATGSTVEGIRQVELRKVEIIIPSADILKKATHTWLVALEKIENNSQQIQTLTKTRDLLLPKLMSGKLRITE